MGEVLISGKTSFKIEVPYKLIEKGEADEKPLIVYLHGFNQNIEQFQEHVGSMLSIDAYHLFIQGPYPIYDRSRSKKVSEWGRAWYLYDGDQQQFVKSMELASEFIQQLIDKLKEQISASRLIIFGYSMGGYLAGYFSLSRWRHVNDVIVVGGRIKTEVFDNQEGRYNHLNVLALHGANDKSVKSDAQEKSCKELAEWGAHVTFREIDAAHKLNKKYIAEILSWIGDKA